MIGISYLTDSVAQSMARRIETMVQDRRYDHVFWEDALFAENGMPVQAKLVPEGAVVEINTSMPANVPVLIFLAVRPPSKAPTPPSITPACSARSPTACTNTRARCS